MSEIGKVIDRVATDALAAPLKAAGYQKAGRTWRRRVGDAIQVVNVQASRWNAGADGRFYLNAGVYFPALAARLALFPPTDAPAESACHVGIRPMPQGRRWWAAAASLELGERDEAVRLFAEAIAQAPPAHADELLAWGRTNGLER